MLKPGDRVRKNNISYMTGEIIARKGKNWFVVKWSYKNTKGQVSHYNREEHRGSLYKIKPESKTGNPNSTFRMRKYHTRSIS